MSGPAPKVIQMMNRGAILGCLLLGSSVEAGPERSRQPARSSRAVLVRDEAGKLIGRGRYVWLARGRVGVPVEAYAQVGVYARSSASGREVTLGVPNSDVGETFIAGRRRFTWFAGAETGMSRYHAFPVARRVGGRLYVAAGVVAPRYRDQFSTQWNARGRILTLQRTEQLGRNLSR